MTTSGGPAVAPAVAVSVSVSPMLKSLLSVLKIFLSVRFTIPSPIRFILSSISFLPSLSKSISTLSSVESMNGISSIENSRFSSIPSIEIRCTAFFTGISITSPFTKSRMISSSSNTVRPAVPFCSFSSSTSACGTFSSFTFTFLERSPVRSMNKTDETMMTKVIPMSINRFRVLVLAVSCSIGAGCSCIL